MRGFLQKLTSTNGTGFTEDNEGNKDSVTRKNVLALYRRQLRKPSPATAGPRSGEKQTEQLLQKVPKGSKDCPSVERPKPFVTFVSFC